MLRSFLPALVGTLLSIPGLLSAEPLFIGTFEGGEPPSQGIYGAEFDPAAGTLTPPRLLAKLGSPTWLAISPNGHTLYAAARTSQSLHAFAINAATSELTERNRLPTGGESPADLVLDSTGRTLVLINFVGASVVAYATTPDGALDRETSRHRHTHFTNTFPGRQTQAHPHAATFSPDSSFLVVPDLGGDRLYLYTHDPAHSTLTAHATQPWVELPPGSGPRNASFSADARHLYLVNELANTVAVFAFDPIADTPLRRLQIISTLPPTFTGSSLAAVSRLSPDGRFLYASNRGHDSIAIFSRDPATGAVTPVSHIPSGGQHPRHFTFSPDARWLLVANRAGHNVVVFAHDPVSGGLTPTSLPPRRLGQPVCLQFLPRIPSP